MLIFIQPHLCDAHPMVIAPEVCHGQLRRSHWHCEAQRAAWAVVFAKAHLRDPAAFAGAILVASPANVLCRLPTRAFGKV